MCTDQTSARSNFLFRGTNQGEKIWLTLEDLNSNWQLKVATAVAWLITFEPLILSKCFIIQFFSGIIDVLLGLSVAL